MSNKFEFNNTLMVESNTPQIVYDSFNDLIFANDTKVIGKFIARTILFDKVKNIPGDIVEVGVFRGSGVLSFLKIKEILAPRNITKVIGFDYYDTDKLLNSLSGEDAKRMSEMFDDREFKHEDKFVQMLRRQINKAGFEDNKFELIKGDINKTASEFVNRRPGFRISLLYIDCDIEEPTFAALKAFWDRMSRGGIILFDDYAVHQWSEAKGAEKFFADKDVQVLSLPYYIPNAYVVKK
jgi:hypothetical protein